MDDVLGKYKVLSHALCFLSTPTIITYQKKKKFGLLCLDISASKPNVWAKNLLVSGWAISCAKNEAPRIVGFL